ncbi:hypothetical protein EW146_g7794 [Bondarzewia mesenterica]|uniref:SAP domain-containing protein n=1 Tax=Bondarzewia mesenterica TaxID=1095465 RepID=A0A4S4LQ12_9AGAM|nr:hypothetical protein EW146_g7794 [Bondarzewia mesenterica]
MQPHSAKPQTLRHFGHRMDRHEQAKWGMHECLVNASRAFAHSLTPLLVSSPSSHALTPPSPQDVAICMCRWIPRVDGSIAHRLGNRATVPSRLVTAPSYLLQQRLLATSRSLTSTTTTSTTLTTVTTAVPTCAPAITPDVPTVTAAATLTLTPSPSPPFTTCHLFMHPPHLIKEKEMEDTVAPPAVSLQLTADTDAIPLANKRVRLDTATIASPISLTVDCACGSISVDASLVGLPTASTGLPFLGGISDDSKLTQRYLQIDGVTNVMLQAHCVEFKLPCSGKKATLTTRLKEFSHNRNVWDSLLLAAHRSHKGPRTDARCHKGKQSMQRHEVLLDPARLSGTHAPLPTEQSKDTRTPEQRQALLDWMSASSAARFVATHSYELPAEHFWAQDTPITLSAGAPLQPNSDSLHMQLHNTKSQLQAVLLWLDELASADADILIDEPTPCAPPPPLPPSSSSTSSLIPSSPISAVALTPTSSLAMAVTTLMLTHSLMLDNGVVIDIVERDMPDPPAVSYAADIARLNGKWDDTPCTGLAPHLWSLKVTSSLLYTGPMSTSTGRAHSGRALRPSGLSGRSIVVQRYRTTTVAKFWAEFSLKNGKHMTFTAITIRLRELRKAEDEEVSKRARDEYSADFNSTFVYGKDSKRILMTDHSAIAKHYHHIMSNST